MIELPIPDRIESPPNPAFVEMLKRAREQLWDGSGDCSPIWSQYICHLIEDNGGYGDLHLRLIDEIGHRLGRDLSYEGWLISTTSNDGLIVRIKSIQAARLRWINQLIEEFGGTP